MTRCVLACCLALLFARAALATPLDDAIALYKEKKIPEARAALETITTAEPQNADACYYLGLTLLRTRDPSLLETAIEWFKKASELQPDNTSYLFEYGGNLLNLSGKTRSLGAANRGREALEKVLKLDPAHLDAREALYQFYSQAPWPIGSSSMASDQIEEIGKRDPNRALNILVTSKIKAKKFDEAFKLSDAALAKDPDNFIALLLYGAAANASGQNLDRALAGYRKCLTLPPPPKMPGPAVIHFYIGNVLEKMGDKPAARAAYEAALEVDANFSKAREALKMLK